MANRELLTAADFTSGDALADAQPAHESMARSGQSWVLLSGPDSHPPLALPHPDFLRLVGNHGTRLRQTLGVPQQDVVLRAVVRVLSGELLIGAVNGDHPDPVVQVRANAGVAAIGKWQSIDMVVPGPVDQVVLYVAADATVIDVKRVSLQRPGSPLTSPGPTGMPAGIPPPEKGPGAMEPRPSDSSALPVAAPRLLPEQGPQGGGDGPVIAYVAINSLSVAGGTQTASGWAVTGPGPGFLITVTAMVDTENCSSLGVSFSAAGATADVGCDSQRQATFRLRAYRAGTLIVTATAHGIDDTDTLSSGTVRRSRATSVAIQVSLARAAPSLTLSAPAPGTRFGVTRDGANVPVSVVTDDTGQFGQFLVSAQPDAGVAVSLTQNPGSATQWAGTAILAPLPLGSRTLTVVCACAAAADIKTTAAVALTAFDNEPPGVSVTQPSPGGALVADAPTMTIQVRGTAMDAVSGVAGGQAGVQVTLTPAGPRTAAIPDNPGDWSSWSATVPVPGYGPNTLYIWATDAAGNTMPAPRQWPVDVISSYIPQTLQERLSDVEYLSALLQLARDQVNTSPGTPVSAGAIAGVLGQPLDTISLPGSPPAAAAQQPVNELRIPAEVLRAYVATSNIPTAPGAAGEASYLSAACQVLLSGIGTSYTELRLARGAPASVRQALAARLGISLHGASSGQSRPDQLDALTLDGAALTEASLEALFGLPATTPGLDPFRTIQPQLMGWQLETQRSQWQAQDTTPPAAAVYTVIIDPDIITTADLQADSAQAGQLSDLLSARAGQLATQATALQAIVTGSGTASSQLAVLLSQEIPGTDLAALQSQDQQGADISSQLAEAGLDRSGFAYLVQLQSLAATGLITAAEWSAAIDVLVGAFRRRQYPTWGAQETGIVLSPDLFQLNDPGPAVSAYRIDPRARASWQATLHTRIIERQALIAGVSGLASTAEQATRGMLRDALLLDVAAASYGGNIGQAAGALAGHYQMDFTVNGSQSTTRLAQATASLQALLQMIRSGDNSTVPEVSSWLLSQDQATFDSAWAWMGSADSWRAATTTFLFPEAALDPSVLQVYPDSSGSSFTEPDACSPAFQELRTALALSLGPPDMTSAGGPVAAYLQQATVTLQASGVLQRSDALSYLSGRSLPHQGQLAAWSAALSTRGDKVLAREIFWAVPMLIGERLHAAGQYQAALDWLWTVFPYNADKPVSGYDVINTELITTMAPPDLTFPPGWTANLNPFYLVRAGVGPYPYRPYTWIRSALLAIIGCLADYADSEFSAYTSESIAHARDLYAAATSLLAHPALTPIQPSDPGEPRLAIPQLQTLAQRVANQVDKLRQDRDIAGLTQTQAISSGNPISAPTPYHFKTLLTRAQQLAQQAATIEAGYLSALEKYDNKTLQVTDAQNAADLAELQLNVHAAQVQEATDAITAANAQQAKATTMIAQYNNAINAPPNQYEQALLSNYTDMRTAQDVVAAGEAAIGIAQISSSGPFGWVGAGVGFAGIAAKAAGQIWANNLQAQAQANQLQASIEDRRQQWQIEMASAQQDALIAAAQVTTATDQQTIALSEQTVATSQSQQAQATLLLLTTQFTSPDLYKWMSDTLGGVYRYFLQQATATARLAQAQLAFERAEPSQAFIRTDYWQPPAQLVTSATPGDTRGMTGAEQLSEDLTQLDQYAFSTDTRRLNLSQSFSLSQLLPAEFISFLTSGQISFSTPMAWFDRDFPGHYQRLIRQVSVSVVALVPPTRGIRATLTSSGISQVITSNNGTFSQVTLRRDPTVIAFTSPMNATGVFTTDMQPDMLLPFEGNGVDIAWDFSLPRAANPFDFSSISDVLITIDYTALNDPGYQAQMIRSLNADLTRSADCVFSLARDFPDQWYTLNNPPPGTASPEITLTFSAGNFPGGILPATLATTQIALQLPASTPLPPIPVTLSHGTASGAAATDINGIASTRRGAPAWAALTGTNPAGDWTLALDTSAAALLQQGLISDVLLIISWTGQVPPWPT